MRRITCGRLAAGGVTAVLVALLSTSPSHAGSKGSPELCASSRDFAALNARVLQTELMVAALSCGEKQRYNSFVTTYQSVLTERGHALQAWFKRVHGSSAESRMNAFITRLANDASQQIRSKGDEYCVFAGELFDEVLASSPSSLNGVSDKPWIASRHGVQPCVIEASRRQPG
jgi:hypothetical protein